MSPTRYVRAAAATGLLLALVWLPAARAQTLTGRVTDATTGEPLIGATVVVPAQNAGAATDAAGRYSLALRAPGAVRVVTSYIGYTADTRSVSVPAGPLALDVALTPSAVEAPAVTVTARSTASDVLSTPQSVAVVDARALARNGGGTPFDALDEVAGVRLLRTGPAIAKPVVRGLTAQRVLVVRDGVRQEGQGWGDEHGPEIGQADVDRIEVVRGPSSLLYGSDALGGVVQTLQRDLFADARPLSGEARVSGLTVSQQTDASLRLGGVAGRWGYEGRVGGLRAGLVRTPDYLIGNTAQDGTTASARVGLRLGERGRLEAEGGLFRQQIGLFEPDETSGGGDVIGAGPPPGRFEIGSPYQRVAHDRAVLRLDAHGGGLAQRVEVVAALQQNRRREFEDATDPALFLRLTTATADVRVHHRPVGPVFGTLGVSGFRQRNETLAEETLIPGGTTLNGAVYAAEQLVLRTVTLDAGARADVRHLAVEASPDLGVDAQTRSYSALTGAVGAAWQPRGDLSLSANLGRAFRAPVLQELFGNGVHEGTLRFERGDADLRPETSLALDVVGRYLSPHVYAEVSAFATRLGGYITPRAAGAVDDESGFQIYDFTQTDARLVGAEARLDVHPHALHGLGIHLQGDVTRGVDTDSDEPLPFVPPARLQVAVEAEFEALGPARDVEARFGPTFVAAQRRPEVEGEVPTDAYATWDASVAGSFALGAATLTPVLAVDNLLDARYVDPLSRYRAFGLLAPGRSVRLALQAVF
jgi:iron complex outermembrane receptor protein